MDCIDKFGLSQTTLARIAERADLSQGNVIFHFHSKEALLEQTLRFISDEYKTNWQTAVAYAGDDVLAQLCASIRAAFDASICQSQENQRLVRVLGRVAIAPQNTWTCAATTIRPFPGSCYRCVRDLLPAPARP